MDPPPKFEEGGSCDPAVSFGGLYKTLSLVKDELSPYGWRAYCNEFTDRQDVERKLKSLHQLPGSGLQASDGMFEGTPLWQERLEKMLLISHLKRKIMNAHSLFCTASEYMLKSHEWLVKDDLLADPFIKSITHVPPSRHEQVDILQEELEESRKQKIAMRNELEDFAIRKKSEHEMHLARITNHQKFHAMPRVLCDDFLVAWSYYTQRAQALRLAEALRVMEARLLSLEADFILQTEEIAEMTRQWNEERDALTKDRDKFKRLYNKMVKAHEQAMEDLKKSQGSAEAQAQMIQVLSMEKSRLTDEKLELEATKKRLLKQLSMERIEVARLREEAKNHMWEARETEIVLLDFRLEVAELEGVQRELEGRLAGAAELEATLRDGLACAQAEIQSWSLRTADVRRELSDEQVFRRGIEAERDHILDFTRNAQVELIRRTKEFRRTLIEVKEAAETRRKNEVEQLTTDWSTRYEKLKVLNDKMAKEIAVADEIGPHLPILNALAVDEGKVCNICRRAIVFEGSSKAAQDTEPG